MGVKVRLAAKSVSQAVQQQLASVLQPRFHSVCDLLLNDHFALGYIYGFVQQANRHQDEQNEEHSEGQYLEDVYASILDKPWTARIYMKLSEFQRRNTIFEKGYRIGLIDLNDWFMSSGSTIPTGLAEYLRPTALTP